VLIVDYYEFDDLFVFANTLGAIDTVRLNGSREEDNQFDISTALFDEDSNDYDVQYDQVFKKNSGYFSSARERSWLNEFLNSTKRYYVTPANPMRSSIPQIPPLFIMYSISLYQGKPNS
jgi:hypothetical protein